MGTRIRVFISSTVEDLENERHQVINRVRQLNFEPVNMEGWAASAAPPWERIVKELESCHLFVLILGRRYGYVPESGTGAADGLSVTHMETRKARELKLPVLPFVKSLRYKAGPKTEEEERRDRFRAEVSDWAAGGVVKEFDLASDLADKVAESLVEVLSDTFLTAAVQERSKSVRALEPVPEGAGAESAPAYVPPELAEAVARREVVLLAGAGISLAAGYPSMRAMTETVTAQLRRELNSPTLTLAGMPFQEIASNIEAAFGRDYLRNIFLRAMSGPQGIEPTEAHLASVRLFDRIVTTNFDALFEEACRRQGVAHAVVEDYADARAPSGGVTIYKLSGSLERPETLLMTERDVWDAYGDAPAVWEYLIETVTRSPVLVVGSSLRDTAVKMLFDDAEGAIRGHIVSPHINTFERLQYRRLNLEPVEATADDFFRRLLLEVGRLA